MIFNKKLALAVSGAVLLMAGQAALADSTSDIVNVLVDKGILTPEEGKLVSKNSVEEKKAAQKSSGKIKISDAIDNATLYGDIRVRHETRWATNAGNNEDYTRNRERYKLTFGVKTEADKGNWYSDLAFAMGSTGRSDNATFGTANGWDSATVSGTTNGDNNKEALYVKRAMLGWKANDWLTLEAGRMANPLYTTEMVWDKDITLEGAHAKLNFKSAGDTKYFLSGLAFFYKGDSKVYSGSTGTVTANAFTNEVIAVQGGFDTPITDKLNGKAAITYYKYGNAGGDFKPTGAGNATAPNGGNVTGTNNLEIFEVPAEIAYKATDTIGVKLFGDYVYNADATKRALLASDSTSAKDDDTAWLLGLEVKSQAGKKEVAGDWNARAWWQETGLYALDPNAVDSDFFDSKINVKGGVFKAQYALFDTTFLNFAYGHGSRYNAAKPTTGVFGDTKFNFSDFDLLQLDLTYKF